MDREDSLPVLPGESLFSEAFRRAQRQQAARIVHRWLTGYPIAGSGSRTQVSLGDIARSVLDRLEMGEIFFVVKSAGEADAPVKARKVRVNLPPQVHPLTGKPVTLIAQAVALQVR